MFLLVDLAFHLPSGYNFSVTRYFLSLDLYCFDMSVKMVHTLKTDLSNETVNFQTWGYCSNPRYVSAQHAARGLGRREFLGVGGCCLYVSLLAGIKNSAFILFCFFIP